MTMTKNTRIRNSVWINIHEGLEKSERFESTLSDAPARSRPRAVSITMYCLGPGATRAILGFERIQNRKGL